MLILHEPVQTIKLRHIEVELDVVTRNQEVGVDGKQGRGLESTFSNIYYNFWALCAHL